MIRQRKSTNKKMMNKKQKKQKINKKEEDKKGESRRTIRMMFNNKRTARRISRITRMKDRESEFKI